MIRGTNHQVLPLPGVLHGNSDIEFPSFVYLRFSNHCHRWGASVNVVNPQLGSSNLVSRFCILRGALGSFPIAPIRLISHTQHALIIKD